MECRARRPEGVSKRIDAKPVPAHRPPPFQIKPAGAGAFITGIDAAEKVRTVVSTGERRVPDTGSATPPRLQRKSVVKVSVGCKEVDALLGGGVESSSITELYGEFRTGACQPCALSVATLHHALTESLSWCTASHNQARRSGATCWR